MKFSMAIEKKNRGNLGTVEGHNGRLHATASQLPKEAWITSKGHHEIMPFRGELIEKAKGLAKRKDAVLAVELVIQVGNQTDWREMPTTEHPYGQRKAGSTAKLNALMEGVKLAAIKEFGKDRIVSIDLHTDESSPHAHIVFAPIVEGKLQAKHWLDGAAKCAELRDRLHSHVTKHIECDFERGAPGGEPIDLAKRAGGPKAPKPAKSLLEKLTGSSEIKALKDVVKKLNEQLQTMFSRLKTIEKRAAASDQRAEELRLIAMKLKTENKALERKIKVLEPEPLVEPKKSLPGPSVGHPRPSQSLKVNRP